MAEKNEVVVIGGGVIGLSCAVELSRRGVGVTVIEKGEVGYGCSYGNAGWITPCFALPLPMPGMFFKSLRWLLDADSPLYIHPQPSWLLFRWLTRFLFSMNRPLMLKSVSALTEISKYSIDAYRALDRESPGVFGFRENGLLMVAQSPAGVEAAMTELKLVGEHGIPGEFLSEEQIKAKEPALTGRLKGGVYFPKEAHGEPLAIVNTLTEMAKHNGARILPRTEVYDFETSGRRVTSLLTTRGEIRADHFVLASGSWSTSLAKSLRLNIPILGGKGYALIVPPFSPGPSYPIMLMEKKIAVTPRQTSVRLAGTLELVNRDESISPRRVRAIIKGAREFMNVPERPEVQEIWRGLRPCTPDGVPVIGPSPRHDNLHIATGHQMLGLQSAPGTGRLIADLLTKAPPAFDPYPFRAERF